MSNQIRMRVEPVRSLAFNLIVAGYTAVGTGFGFPSRILYIQNLSDATLMFSLDGTNDAFPLVASGYVILDVTTNKSEDAGCFFAKETIVYVKRIGIPSVGSVYVSTFYAS